MAFGFAGAAQGAANSLEDIVAERMKEQMLAAEIANRQQQAALEQQRIDEMKRGNEDDRTFRQSQIDRQSAQDREKNNQRGVRRMIGESLIQRGETPMGPADRRDIAALQVEAGDLPDMSLLTEPKPTPAKLRPVTVKGPKGEPINRMVPETEDVEEYRSPDKTTAPKPEKPEYEWVIGADGKPRQSIKGQALPGDAPYRAPQSISENAQDRQRSARVSAARDFLARLNTLRQRINTKMGPEAGLSGTVRRGKAAIGMDPDVAEYRRIRAAGGRSLAVAIMGAQNLSDADADAWANMLPAETTDEDTAGRLTTQVEKMLDGMSGGNPAPSGSGSGGDAAAAAQALIDKARAARKPQ